MCATANDHPADGHPTDDLTAELYDELRALAQQVLGGPRRASPTLQPTALVHEAYVRLAGRDDRFDDRTHFRAVAARAMRHVVIDLARTKGRTKRGGDRLRITLHEESASAAERDVDLVHLSESLAQLTTVDPRAARVVELRFFGGFAMLEIAELLEVSERTVRNDWVMARAWLRRELAAEGPSGDDPSSSDSAGVPPSR